jgi:hypothetical protein
MSLNRLLLISLGILILSIFGCSSDGKTPISTGSDSDHTLNLILRNIPVGVSSVDASGNPSEGIGTLGLFSLHIDSLNLTGEMTSLRSSSLEDVLETVDITNFLQLAPCSDCVKLHAISLDPDGHLVLSIGIRHPFSAGDPLKPISGKNRGDLHVFNVEGYMISDGIGTNVFGLLGEASGGFKLVNADGVFIVSRQSVG